MENDNEKIRYMSESSNASTSGYSTMSPNAQFATGLSPASSTYSSPAPSPRTAALPNDLSNLHIPSNASLYPQQQQSVYMQMQQQQQQPPMVYTGGLTYMELGGSNVMNDTIPMVTVPMQQSIGMGGTYNNRFTNNNNNMFTNNMDISVIGSSGAGAIANNNNAHKLVELEITEQPVEKFRFRYKSEMHGTHGSLNGANSKRTPKTFPEVKLKNFDGRAIIRCSLFQWNLESPHSHQLVVRKDDTDLIDPHEVQVSSKDGYVASFQNMGIIHTAKKNIFEELLKKKTDRVKFQLGRDTLSTKQDQQLRKETEKEAKDMDLNKVRLCFEAYKIEDNSAFTLIAGPIYSNPINNRKSAQTGELRICRLSHSSGSVLGGEDLILLVEKVNKKNIKVRFFEKNDDDETVWSEYAKFRESDVHHQYAIVCQTPPYRNKEIESEVEVYVELVRPTDDERSDPPRTFRYKPRSIVTRKRRRTNSSAHNSYSSGSSLSSVELPKTVQEQTANMAPGVITNPESSLIFDKSEELKNFFGSDLFKASSEELTKMCTNDLDFGALEMDGAATTTPTTTKRTLLTSQILTSAGLSLLWDIIKIYEDFNRNKSTTNHTKNDTEQLKAAKTISEIYTDFAERHEIGDTIIHEIIEHDNFKYAIRLCNILKSLNKTDLLSQVLNLKNESVLHYACIYDRCHYIRPLLGLGCDPNILDSQNNTALHVAIREQHQKCAESLLNMHGVGESGGDGGCGGNGVQINLSIKNDEGLTPLHLAIKLNNDAVAKRIIELSGNAALVANSKDGNTALHMAIQNRNFRLVQAIMNSMTTQRDELLKCRNAAGHTPSEFARQVGGEIWNYMRTFVKDTDFITIIKEEEMSSSSFTDDEDESSDYTAPPAPPSVVPIQSVALELVKVKKEDNANDNDRENILQLFDDAQQYEALVAQLNQQDRWKILADELKYNHLICLWSNASEMLTYLRQKNMENIVYSAFANALRRVIGISAADKFLKSNI